MIDDIERALRDEFAMRADGVPQTDDITDRVIVRAKRTRQRRRIAASAAAVVLVAATGVGVGWSLRGDSTEDAPPAGGSAETDGLSTLARSGQGDGIVIIDGDGKTVDIGMNGLYTVWEVDGGWLLSGESTEGSEVSRYVDHAGRFTDLSEFSGEPGLLGDVYPNPEGNGAVLVTYPGNGGSVLDFYSWTEDTPPERWGTQSEVSSDFMSGGMASDQAWMVASDGSENLLAQVRPEGGVSETTLTDPVEPLAALANGKILADVSRSGDTLCPAVVDSDDFAVESEGKCIEGSAVYPGMVTTSPDAGLVMCYVEPAESVDAPVTVDDEGEWMWLDLSMRDGFSSTGHSGYITPTITAEGDVFYGDESSGTIDELNRVIPRLDA